VGLPAASAPDSTTGAQAVDRAASLLREVVVANEPVSFGELLAASGLAKSTVSRLLVALARNGLLLRDESGAFVPGDLFVRYAGRHGDGRDLVAAARPFLDLLGERTGETINLGVTRRGFVEQVAQVDSKYMIGGTNWLGRPVPLHCAALGKVLLAYGAAELPSGRLERCAPKTVTSRSRLAADLDQVRRRGYSVADEELEPGLVAVAAPVYRDTNRVVAALSVSGPALRLSGARLVEVAGECVTQANALSATLGYRPLREGVA
jgi:IclR family transcriptional regulator, acetate operon repressor